MRDYIGSADAYHIFKENYTSLMKSKLADNQFVSDAMARGIMLERDIVEQYAIDNNAENVGLQLEFQSALYDYCKCTVDAFAEVEVKTRKMRGVKNAIEREFFQEIWEVKTSKEPCPKDQGKLMDKYPQYWYQVQYQMWVSGIERAKILWCECPDVKSEESPYDEDGKLNIKTLEVPYNSELEKVWTKNCPEFWQQWTIEKEKANDESAFELSGIVPITSYLELEKLVEATAIELASQQKLLGTLRSQILEEMEKSGTLRYETDDVRISYVAPSKRQTIDSAKLKEDGLYEKYAKTSNVRSSIRVTLKGEK